MSIRHRQSTQRPSQPNGNGATDGQTNISRLSIVVTDTPRFNGQHGDEHYEAADVHQREQQFTEWGATQLYSVLEGVEIIHGEQKVIAAGNWGTASR